jgi:hypothetical protein
MLRRPSCPPLSTPAAFPALRILLTAALLLAASTAAAGPQYRFAVGAAKPHEERWTGTLTLGLERDWRPFHGGRLSWDAMLVAIDARDGEGPGLDRDVQLAGAGLRWRRSGFINGFAVALATPRTDAISGPVQFVTTIGYGRNGWAVLLKHISNAGFKGRNHGETILELEWAPGRREPD